MRSRMPKETHSQKSSEEKNCVSNCGMRTSSFYLRRPMMMKAITIPYSAIASTSANPIHMSLPTRPSASGWRATASIIFPKMYPIPTPAPANPAAANPIPNSAADAASIQRSPFSPQESLLVCAFGMPVQGDGIAEVHAGQYRKDVSLNNGNPDFQGIDGDRKDKREPTDPDHGQDNWYQNAHPDKTPSACRGDYPTPSHNQQHQEDQESDFDCQRSRYQRN